MAKVMFFPRTAEDPQGGNRMLDFDRIPAVGECVALSADSPYYQVYLVVHAPFPCSCDAEVYAVEVDHMAARKQALARILAG